MKKYLILILMIFNILLLNSQDQANDNARELLKNQKAFEISTGLSLINSFSLELQKMKDDYFDDVKYDGYIPIISIPISIVYYPCNYYGIGGSYQLGFGLFLIKSMTYLYPANCMLINKIKFVNKFGSLNKKMWFLLETGINLNGRFSLQYYIPHFNELNYFSFGPSIFIGYENIFGKNVECTVGFVFDGIYHYEDFLVLDQFEYIRLVVPEKYVWNLNYGIEFRIKFDYLKIF